MRCSPVHPTLTPRHRLGALGLAVLVTFAACGGGHDGAFDRSVADVRSAVARGDRTAALAGLDALALDGLAAHDEGAITDAELTEVAARIDSLRVQIDTLLPPPSTTTTTTTTTTSTSPPRDPHDDDDDEDKPGKGKDRDD